MAAVPIWSAMAEGVIASVAGLVFLYLPATPLAHRMITLAACALGMTTCYAARFAEPAFPSRTDIDPHICGDIGERPESLLPGWGPPGSLFFIMTAAIGAYSPGSISDAPFRLGIFVLGTSIGLILTWALVEVTTDRGAIAGAIVLLTLPIETAVVRHYGFAAIFITLLTILLAEAPTLGQGRPASLIEARLLDTVVGAMIGFAGAACLHNPSARRSLGTFLRRFVPFARAES